MSKIKSSPHAINTLNLTDAIAGTAMADFHSDRYLRNTARRLEHLASLDITWAGKTVLEVGAGIGDLTTFFLDRGCTVHATEGRAENYDILRQRYANEERVTTELLDVMLPPPSKSEGTSKFDIVFSYGLLYHCADPAAVLNYLASRTREILLLETIVRPDGPVNINPIEEDQSLAGSALHGTGCRPHRQWVWNELLALFNFVYVPTTQPWHIEFPIDWSLPTYPAATRTVYIGSRTPLHNKQLSETLLSKQTRI